MQDQKLLGSSLSRIQGYPLDELSRREMERERRHVRPALIGPSLRGRERERERERERGREREREREENEQTGVFAVSGRVWQCFVLHRGFYALN